MKTRIKIDGVYDQRTIQMLEQDGIKDVAFDFRPTSFNFLQQHAFLDILKNGGNKESRYFMRYENEQDFVIQKMLNDLKTSFKEHLDLQADQFYLEFSDQKEREFYDSFQTHYFLHYHPMMPLKSLIDSHYLKGLVISYSLLKELREQNRFYNFVQNLLQVTHKKQNLELTLSLDWDADIFPSLFDFMDFDTWSLAINNQMEVCYRNVDLSKVARGLEHYRSFSHSL